MAKVRVGSGRGIGEAAADLVKSDLRQLESYASLVCSLTGVLC